MQPPDDKLRRRLLALAEEAAGAPYWAYALRDPLTGDRRDWTTGDPIHLGQTADPVRQAERHMAAAQAPGSASALNQRLHQVLASGRIPVFELLEGAATRLAALAAEARWARRFAAEGFELLGPKAADAAEEFGTTGVPVARAWTLTLDEARADGVGLRIACEACGLEQALDLAAVAARSRPDLPLAPLRDAFACPNCGRAPCLDLVPPPAGEA